MIPKHLLHLKNPNNLLMLQSPVIYAEIASNIAKFLLEAAKENYVFRTNITTAHGDAGKIGRRLGL